MRVRLRWEGAVVVGLKWEWEGVVAEEEIYHMAVYIYVYSQKSSM